VNKVLDEKRIVGKQGAREEERLSGSLAQKSMKFCTRLSNCLFIFYEFG
jgi:hypothetical protein